jgi:hypothetical protein
MSEDQIEEYFKKKYSSQPSSTAEGADDVYDDISQHGLLPSTKDPNLWIVRCRMGEERGAALQIMRKYIAYEHTEEVIFDFSQHL